MPKKLADEFERLDSSMLQSLAVKAGRKNKNIALGALIALKKRELNFPSDEPSMVGETLAHFEPKDRKYFRNYLARTRFQT